MSDAGEDLFDVMDSHSSEMSEYHAAFFKPNGWDYKESIRREFPDILTLDLLILDRAEIEPAFRKQGLGLLAISRVIDVFGENCGLVAMKPFPLQFGNYLNFERHVPNGLQDPTTEFRIAKQKLRRYWERAGFKRVGGTEYWALSPAAGHPPLKNINSAIDEACAADE
jgi:GNAT superfamily N-acetyltransferase